MRDETAYRALLAILDKKGPAVIAEALVAQARPEQLAPLARMAQRVHRAALDRAEQMVNAGLPDPLARPARQGPRPPQM